MKDHSISVDQARYDTSIVAKYLDTATDETSTNVYKTTLPSDMIFTKVDASTSDEKVGGDTLFFKDHVSWQCYLIKLVAYLNCGIIQVFCNNRSIISSLIHIISQIKDHSIYVDQAT